MSRLAPGSCGSSAITPLVVIASANSNRLISVGLQFVVCGCRKMRASRRCSTDNQEPATGNHPSSIMHAHCELQHTAGIGLGYTELETAEHGFFAGFRQMAEFGSYHAADGVELVVGELAAEAVVEIGDRRQGIDQEAAVGLRLDQLLARG